MKKFYHLKTPSTYIKKTGRFTALIFALFIAALLPVKLFGQTLSYNGPQTYAVGAQITPLIPASTGVAAPAYSTTKNTIGSFNTPTGIAVDPSGNVFAPNFQSGFIIQRIPAGLSSYGSGYSTPYNMTADAAGNIYVTDVSFTSIEKITPTGAVFNIGTGLSAPSGVALDAAGNVYVSELGNTDVIKIAPGGATTVLANGFGTPYDVALDGAGNVYLLDQAAGIVYEIPAGTTTTVTNPATQAVTGLTNPTSLNIDASGNMFIINNDKSIIEVSNTGVKTTLLSSLNAGFGVATDGAGNVYVADNGASKIYKFKPTGGYFISPALPAGLSFNSNTGVISGTPTASSPATNYTITAYSGTTSVSATVSIKTASTNPNLSGLDISQGTLSPAFAAATLNYTASVTKSPLNIIPTTVDASAIVTINGNAATSGVATPVTLSLGSNTINISVKSGDGTATQAYMLTVNYAQTDATLSNLAISTGTLSPVFATGTNSYSVIVPATTTSVTITPTTNDAFATVQINSAAVTSGTASASVPITTGATVIPVTVTAGDGVTQDIYTITVNTAVAPTLSYSGPQTYNTGASISPLMPTGANVAPLAYNTALTVFASSAATATTPVISSPTGITTDAANNVYFVNFINGGTAAIQRIPKGTTTSYGTGFQFPYNISTDAAGNIYVADPYKTSITKINPVTNTQTAIGTGLSQPLGVAADAAGNVYVAENGNTDVVKIAPNGTKTVLANGFIEPNDVALDAAGNLYVVDYSYSNLYKIPAGTTTTQSAGSLTVIASPSAGLYGPASLAIDPERDIFVANAANNTVTEIAANGSISTFASGFTNLFAVATDGAGNVYMTDGNASKIYLVSPLGGYFVSPALPAGLSIDNNTGIISGTPTTGTPAANYTITAYNAVGTPVSATVNIATVSTNANLASLALSSGTLSPGFASGTLNYTASVNISSINVTPVTSDPTSTITINGTPATTGTAFPVSLTLGNNVIAIVVTAGSGATQTYTVTVNYSLSTVATLLHLTSSSGAISPTFSSNTINYTAAVTVPTVTITPTTTSAFATVTVNGSTVTSGTASGSITLTPGSNAIPIVVTAQDGVTKKTYTITYTYTPSTVTTLSHLTISSGTLSPAFSSTKITYTDAVSVSPITVTPTVTNSGATVTVNGSTVTSGTASGPITLASGPNTITTKVTAASGATETYTITVTYTPSTVSTLSHLTISSGTLNPAFATAKTSYTATVINSVSSINITPTVTNSGSAVTITNTTITSTPTAATSGSALSVALNEGVNVINVTVTAADGIHTSTYTVTITRALSSDATLSALAINTGTLSPSFVPATLNYSTALDAGVTSLGITPTVNNADAVISLNGATIPSGQATNVSLSPGDNFYNINVTAGDGTVITYTLDVTVNAAASTSVTAITANVPAQTNAATIDYTVTFADAITGLAPGNFTLTTDPAITGASITSVTGSGTTYDVMVNTGTGDGLLALNFDNASGLSLPVSNAPFESNGTSIDKTPPTAGDITLTTDGSNPALAIINDDVTLTFTPNETLKNDPTVTIAGHPVTLIPFGLSYEAVYTMQATDAPGNIQYEIDMTDLAGNSSVTTNVTSGVNLPFSTTPIITVAGTPLQALSTVAGTPSGYTFFTFTGNNITTDGVLVTAPAGFEVSPDNGAYSSSFTLAQGLSTSSNIFVRLAAADVPGNYSGDVVLSNGATSVNVATANSTVTTPVGSIISIAAANPNPSNAASVDFTVVFAQAVTGLSATNFTLTAPTITGASITSVTGSGDTYDVMVNTGTSDGTLALNFDNSTGLSYNITNAPFTGDIYTVDKTPPAITIGAPSVSSVTSGTSSVTYDVSYSDAYFNSSSLFSSNVSLNQTGGASASAAVSQNSATDYTVTLSNITGNGTLGISIAAGTATDQAGNSAAAASSSTFNVVLPTTTITELVRDSPDPTQGGTVSFLVEFADPVSGLSAADFSLVTTGSVSGASIGSISGSGTAYGVNVNTGTGEGTITLNFTGSSDLDHTVINAPFNGQAFTIDKTPPAVTSVALPPDRTYGVGGAIQFVVTFSEPVTVNTSGGTPYIGVTLNTGGTVQATYASGSTSQQLTFTYTVVSGNADPDGIAVDNAITFNGATFSDFAGNLASSEPLTGIGSTSGILVDAVPPAVNSITLADGNPTNATTVDYTVTFSEPVTGVTSGAFSLVTTSGNAAGAINTVTPVSSSVYTVNVTSVSGNGGLRLDLSNVSGISDLNGNPLASTFTGSVYAIDTTPATLTSGSYFSNNGNSSQYAKVGDVLTLSVGYNEQLQSAAMTIGGNTVPVTFTNGNQNFSGTYTMTPGDTEGNVGWTLNATDLAGNVRNYTNNDFGTVLIFDKTPPAISISAPSQAVANAAATVNYTVTYSDANFNFSTLSTGDITLNTTNTANATVSVSGSGTSYTVSLSNITGEGTIGFTIGAGTAQDIPGNVALAPDPSPTFTVDNTPPTIAISAPSATSIGNNGTGSISYTVTYADANFSGSTLGLGDITLNATGTATGTVGLTGSGTSYTVTISNISGLGTLGISIGAGTATDQAGNTAPASGASATFNVLASDAVLANLTISNGNLTPGFAPGTFTYTDAIANLTSSITVLPTADDPNATITVNGTAVATGVRSTGIPMSVGPNTVTITVTAQDGVTTQSYTITVNRALPNNALLSAIVLSPATTLVVTTGPGNYNYNAAVANSTGSIQVKPTAQDGLATITVNGSAVTTGTLSQGIQLNVGANTITTVVTAQDGSTTKTYIITVNRGAAAVASLSNLAVNQGTLSPVFATSTNAYVVTVPYTTTSINFTPITTDPNATVTVNGAPVNSGSASGPISLGVGNTSVTTVITAQNGVTKQTYNTVVTRLSPSSNALLTSITTTPATTLVTATGTGYLNYTASVSNSTTSIQVTPTATDPTATITVNGSTVASGTLSQSIALNVGANTITTVLTAQDGSTTKTVIITVNRAPSANAALASLAVNAGTLTPAFATGTYTYSVSVPNTVQNINITPATADATATMTVGGAPTNSGSPANVGLALGLNSIPVVVTAQDGSTTKTYTVNVTRVPSGNSFLTSISLTPHATLVSTAGPGYYNYTAAVATSTASVQVTPVTADATATVTVNGSQVTSGSLSQAISLNVGANTITTVVTAQDGSTKTAFITVNRAAAAVASLANLTISAGSLSPAFATGTLSYTASVPYPVSSVILTPTTTDPNATVTVNGGAATSGTGSTVALSVGLNKIVTVVTAQNGVTKSTYNTYITRAAPSTNALYTSIVMSPASTLVGTTGPGYLNYTTAVANSEASVQVITTAKDATATITVNGSPVASGSPSQAIALNVGANTVTIVITAQDGVTTKNAIITVNRAMQSVNSVYNPISVTKPAEQVSIEDGITVHQAVSPNGDGINDYLTIEGIANHPENNLMIMDRNGVMVYQAKGYDNSSKMFDGHSSINGKMQLPGTYFYSLDYTVNGENKHKTGYIILKY